MFALIDRQNVQYPVNTCLRSKIFIITYNHHVPLGRLMNGVEVAHETLVGLFF